MIKKEAIYTKTDYYTNKWLRWLEMVLLVLAIIFFPLPIFIIAINLLQSSNSSDKGPGNVMFIVGLSALILFGLLLGNSLKHYLYHQETRDDVLIARLSPFLIFGSLYVYYLSLIF